jgi:hypothetical protein
MGGIPVQPVQHGQNKSGGLAGAGLGGAQKVFASEDDGDGLGLDGSGMRVALFCDRTREFGPQAETFEGIANGVTPDRPVKGLPSTGSGRAFIGLLLNGPGWTAKNGLRR